MRPNNSAESIVSPAKTKQIRKDQPAVIPMQIIRGPSNLLRGSLTFFSIVITVLGLSACLATESAAFQAQPQIDSSVSVDTAPADSTEAASNSETGLSFLALMMRGGWFMIPLGLLSILVVSLSIERALALRRDKMMPKRLVDELGRMAADEEGFEPRRAYKLCQKFPSAAAKVVQTMLLKAGRPQQEIENSVAESAQREATKLYAAVSWLNLAAAVAPLIGLLGTVWGITQAFYVTTQMSAMENKGPALAEGIYTALVTTMIGLSIAIPAAVLAHIFENRIVSWFNRIDEMVLNLTPQLEPLEGRLRTSVDKKTSRKPASESSGEQPEPATVPR